MDMRLTEKDFELLMEKEVKQQRDLHNAELTGRKRTVIMLKAKLLMLQQRCLDSPAGLSVDELLWS